MRIVTATDRNTRALAKLASAVFYMTHGQDDPALLLPLMEQVFMERQQLRRQLWDELKRQGVA